jgi:hypothetical protein
MKISVAILAAATTLAPAASQADDWNSGSYQSKVFTAGIRNSAHAGIDIECRATNYGRSEVIIDLRVPMPAGSKPAASTAMAFTADEKTITLPVQLLGTEWDTTTYRWMAWDQPGYEVARSLADELESARSLDVKDAAAGTTMMFVASSLDGSGHHASTTIRRCGKEAMRARENAAKISDLKVLLAFENDTNERCRGGSGDERSTWNACDERTEYEDRLSALGMCYGKAGQSGFQMSWHRCTANSLR